MACVLPYFAQPPCFVLAPPQFQPFRHASCSSTFPSSASQPSQALRDASCSSFPSSASQQSDEIITVQWERPPVGWLKLNFDGSVYHDGSGRASIGGAIRDRAGCVLAAFAERTEHSSVGVVEARALIRGLWLAFSFYRGPLVVEGDDRVLVKLLRREDEYRRIPQAMEDEIRALLGYFADYEVQHIYREGNQVADALCHEAYQRLRPGEWRGGIVPRAILEKVKDDAHGKQHERIRKAKV